MELAAQYRAGAIGFGGAKKLLKEKIDAYFMPFRAKRKELAARLDTVEDILREGAKRARVETQRTMEKVYKATGLR
jgi:tryptophanyl-tRNA synthetase